MDSSTLIDEFTKAVESAGLPAPATIRADGGLHRFSTNGKSGDDSGWYVLFDAGAGAFGCWRSGINQKWSTAATKTLSRDEKAALKRRMREAAERGRQERERKQVEAAEIAKAAWHDARPALADHPYLVKKQVQPHGLRVDDDNQILVPMAVDGELLSLQLIDTAGDKCFIPGGRTQGASCTLGTAGETVYIAEGFATAATIREATGAAVVVAFSAANLAAVANAIRDKYPDAEIIVAADNDAATDGNPGIDKATKAAKQINGCTVAPDAEGDFNDLYVKHGAQTVREQLRGIYPPRNTATAQPDPAKQGAPMAERLQPPMQPDATLQPKPPPLAFEPAILSAFREAVAASGVVGEQTTAATLYLLLTSRLLDKPVSAAVKGHSASGKSFTAEKTVEFFPDDAIITMTAMSERALIYSDQDYAHRVIVLYEATAMRENAEDNMTAYLLRSLLSEGRIEYPVTVRGDDGAYTVQNIVKEGPTGLLVTTTKTQVHAENETRLLSLATDDSRDQTSRVFQALAQETAHEADKTQWLQLQAWLGIYGKRRVTIPFARRLADLVPPVAVRLRRDFGAVLALIRAHAILHQCSRETDDSDRIIATIADYAEVRALVAHVVAEGVGATVPPILRETVAVVDDLTDQYGVTAAQIAQRLNLDKATLSRRLRMAADAGYVRNLETKRGQPGRWVLGDPMPDELVLLPEPEAVARLHPVAKSVATENEAQATDKNDNNGTGCAVARTRERYTPGPADTAREHYTV